MAWPLVLIGMLVGACLHSPAAAQAPSTQGMPGWTLPQPANTPAPPGAPALPDNCPCKSAWTYYFDPPNPYLGPSVLVTGCANPNGDPNGDWCEVEANCTDASVKTRQLPNGQTVLWDYCARGGAQTVTPAATQPSPSPPAPPAGGSIATGYNLPSPAPAAGGLPATPSPAASPAPSPAAVAAGPAAVAPGPAAPGGAGGVVLPAPPPAPAAGGSAAVIAVAVAVPVGVLAILGLVAVCYRRRVNRWWHRVKPKEPALLPDYNKAGRGSDGGGAPYPARGPYDGGGGGKPGLETRMEMAFDEEDHANQPVYVIDMSRPDAGPGANGRKTARSMDQGSAALGKISGSGGKSVAGPDTPPLPGTASSLRVSHQTSAGLGQVSSYRTPIDDSLGSAGLGGTSGYGIYANQEGLSGISGVTYDSYSGQGEGTVTQIEVPEPMEAHYVRVFIQIVPVGTMKREAIRLWLVPLADEYEEGPGTQPSSLLKRRVSVILPSDPVNMDADLNLDYDRDLAFPLYSYIGAGAFGQVHRAILKGHLPVAVKLITGEAAPPGVQESLIEEIQIMSRINHPNVVKCYGGCQTPPTIFIVEELMDCCLADLLHPKHARGLTPLPLKRMLEISADVANALWYLHPSIVHRDLKPGNVLLGPSGIAKVGDFGISRIKLASYLATQHLEAGTVSYMAPECFTKEWGVGEKSDVYSLGIMMHEMITGLRPWAEFGFQMAIVYQVVHCDNRPEFPKYPDCPESLRRLIKSCWRRNPRERPSAGDVLQRLSLMLKQLDTQGRI